MSPDLQLAWEVMKWPLVACLLFPPLLVYLGLHVVKREVIFVDLALAQVATLGTCVALLMGHHFDDRITFWISLGVTFIGAAFFSWTRSSRKAAVPQEAIIGITFVVAAAGVILLLSRVAGGKEELEHLLTGDILNVTRDEIGQRGILFGVIAMFYAANHRRFALISETEYGEPINGLNVRLWDFLFYASFGFVVTRSVAIAGVLLVFCYLIVPSVAAMLYSERIGPRLAIGWTMGTVVSAAGVWLSLRMDLPTGATIVCTFGVVLILMALVRVLVPRKEAVAVGFRPAQ